MEIQFSEQQAGLLDSVETVCRQHSSIEQVRLLLDSDTGFDATLWQTMVELGWASIGIPERYGGADIGFESAVPVIETLGKYLCTSPLYSSLLVSQLLLKGATESQQQHYLPLLATGTIGSVALLENSDWGNPSMATRVTATDQGYSLSGYKLMVQDAMRADFFLVYAQCCADGESSTQSSTQSSDQPCWVIVPNDGAVVKIAHRLVDETKRAAKISFDNLALHETQLLPLENSAQLYREAMLLGALLTATEATGSSASALNTIVNYLQTRRQFGKLIGSYQSLKHPSVEILLHYNDSRSLLYGATAKLTASWLSKEAEILCRMAKVRATQTLIFAADRAVQFHGGMGFTYECDAQLFLRKAQWLQQYFGDDLHHKKRLADLLLMAQPQAD